MPRATNQRLGSDPGGGLARPAEPPQGKAPLVRLRTLLALAVLGVAGWQAYPRALAAWQLHTSAAALADYALCMVGPTGPALLRDNPAQFRALVRRRLVSSIGSERPFAPCAVLVHTVVGASEIERLHGESAASFVEWGGAAADRAAAGAREPVLADLEVGTRTLAALAARAWPFVRDGYMLLVRPSVLAREAVHPVELPRPAVGSGVPAWRSQYRSVARVEGGHLLALGHGANLSVYASKDGGVTWLPGPARHPSLAEFAERCVAGTPGRSFTFALSDDGRASIVTSLGPDGEPHGAVLADAQLGIVAASCDATGFVVALRAEGARDVAVRLCAYRGTCLPLELPRLYPDGPRPTFPLDLARLDGVTVVAAVMHGTVRVASSRDDGRTWTPYTVAFDAAAHRDLGVDVKVPSRLLTVEHRLMLSGVSAKVGQRYPVVASDDQGASWHSP